MVQMDKNRIIALVFALLSLLFIILCMTNTSFFEWVFDRHHNPLSWYIRPLFLIPFCIFSYKRNWAGISLTIFCLLTSMFWFDKPVEVGEHIKSFLEFEKEWLLGHWNFPKTLLLLTIPSSFLLLGLSFWRRNIWMGLSVVVLIAAGKIFWSVYNAGESGKSILIPALVGLFLCFGFIFFGINRLEKRKSD